MHAGLYTSVFTNQRGGPDEGLLSMGRTYVRIPERAGTASLCPWSPKWAALWDILGGIPAEGDLPASPATTVMLFIQDGRLKVCLLPKDTGAKGFLTLDSPETALEDVVEAVDGERIDWQVDTRSPRRR
jgi:hypothetical protein